MRSDAVEIVQCFRLEAAHFLPNVPDTHKCKRVHGHSYTVDIEVAGPVDATLGWVVDFAAIENAFRPVFQAIDHRLLNEVMGLENPTAEHIAAWIWDRLEPGLPGLSRVTVHETEHSRATVRRG